MATSILSATPAKAHKKHHSTATAPAAKTSKTSKASAKRKGKSSKQPARWHQQQPTPERYKEIQQALASKGFLQGEPTGQWGEDSVDALKRFQASQNLMPDGKIGSLSLIALGLGPKRLTAKSDAVPPAVVAPAPTQTPAAPAQ
jgi:peptidoglycan hydrolase-like protein with peptidoglycan-binding domain